MKHLLFLIALLPLSLFAQNRIETVDGVPCLFLEAGGGYYATAANSTHLINQLVNGSRVFVDGTVNNWTDIRFLGASSRDTITVVPWKAPVTIRHFEGSGGLRYVLDGTYVYEGTLAAGEYGITVDHQYTSTGQTSAVMARRGNSENVDHIEFKNVKIQRGEFANTLLKNDNQDFPSGTFMSVIMDGVQSTDTKIGETNYVGNTTSPPGQHPMLIQVSNSMFGRSGAEVMQVASVVDGSYVKNSSLLFGSLDHLQPFQPNQDKNFQINHRYGQFLIENTMILGANSGILSILHYINVDPTLRDPTDEIRFKNCLIGYGAKGEIYIGRKSGAVPAATDMPKVVFENCYFIAMGKNNRTPWDGEAEAGYFIKTFTSAFRVEAINCVIDNENPNIVAIMQPGVNRTETNTTFTDLPVPDFTDPLVEVQLADYFDFHKFKSGQTYNQDWLVMGSDRHLYRVTATSTTGDPVSTPADYNDLGEPGDDYTLAPGDFYRNLGIGKGSGGSTTPTTPTTYNYVIQSGTLNVNGTQSIPFTREFTSRGYSVIAAPVGGDASDLVKIDVP